jgi:hypothetical protein
MEQAQRSEHLIEYTLDGEPQTTTEKVLTPNQILDKGGLDPATHYLIELVGHEKKSYENNGNAQIHMHPKMKFTSVFTGTTPVS